MIPRYTPDDIGAIWTETHKVRTWLRVELAVCEAMSELGLVPKEDVASLRKTEACLDFDALSRRADEHELRTKHDIIAFLTAFEEEAGSPARHVHFGLTSSDVLDTSLALRLVEATELVETALIELRAALKKLAEAHRTTPMIGRSHGIHAEPVTFGLVVAGWYAETTRGLRRLRAAKEEIRVGKLSGAVGTHAHLPPRVESLALERLGLRPETVATQVVARDRHAQYFQALALLAAAVERISVQVRHLQRTEVREVEEPFTVGQKGSSAMPHKRNPILTENLTGLARLMRGWAQAAVENVALWHERDISHSSVERVIAPDATITAVFMLRRLKRVMDGLVVYPDRMQENLDRMAGLPFSQGVLLDLVRLGIDRQAAYEMVQRCAMRVWDEGISLHQALSEDTEVMDHLGGEALSRAFDLTRHTEQASHIIDRALSESVD